MTWEMIKEKNGWKTVQVDDISIGDVFLFSCQKKSEQGNKVVDIFSNGSGNIIVEYIPEWTPVRNTSMFIHGKNKFTLKK